MKTFITHQKQSKTLLQKRRGVELVSAMLMAASGLALSTSAIAADDTRPNIVLLVADDAGYSDFAGFGGEAQTPAMDSLAGIGTTLTNFHAMPNCTPSRSTFLTGSDNHINGVGTMQGQLGSAAAASQVGAPGYKGYANDRNVMISTLLKDSGYSTYMVGKWHLGEEGEVDGQTVFKRGTWPIDRGFERSFGILNGGADHFGACERVEGTCTRFFEDEEILIPTLDFAPGPLSPDPSSIYFSATAHTDKAIDFIGEGTVVGEDRKPFFLYYADTMPHEPAQLPAEYLESQRMQDLIAMYREKGWDGVRADRFQKMKDLGILPKDITLPPRHPGYPAWDDEEDAGWTPLMNRVTQPPYNVLWSNKDGAPITTVAEYKDVLAKKMAIYTGMVEFFDSEVARMIQHLKDIGEYENTLFVYFSDNGGDSREWDWLDRDMMLHGGINNSYDNLGKAGSFIANGKEWAQAVNVPFYGAKATVAEGGLKAAFVAAYPGGDMAAGTSSNAMTTVMDVPATILDYAQVTHPVGVGVKADWDNCNGTYNNKSDICPMNGKSMRTLMKGEETALHDRSPIGYEIFGRKHGPTGLDRPNKAMFYEEDGVLWKLLRLGDGGWGAGLLGTAEPWKLFNLTVDPSESNDLRETETVRFTEMLEMYDEYEQNVGVIPQSAVKDEEVTAGADLVKTYTLTNDTGESETYNISCRSDWACTLDRSGAITLADGESADIQVTIGVPVSAAGQVRTTQLNMKRENQPEMSRNQVYVTHVSKTAVASDSTSTSSGGGSMTLTTLLGMLIATFTVMGFRRRNQIQWKLK